MKLSECQALLDRYDALCAIYRQTHPNSHWTGPPKYRDDAGNKVAILSVTTMASRHMAKERGWTIRRTNSEVWQAKRKLRLSDRGLVPIPEPQSDRRLTVAKLSTYGVPMNEAWLREVVSIQRKVKSAQRLISDARAILSALVESDLPIHKPTLRGVMRDCARVVTLAHSVMPVSLCPYCKGIASVQEQCVMCKALGYLTVGQTLNVPTELKSMNHRMVMVGRKLVPITDYYQSPQFPVVEET
jgi:hypothetical protein